MAVSWAGYTAYFTGTLNHTFANYAPSGDDRISSVMVGNRTAATPTSVTKGATSYGSPTVSSSVFDQAVQHGYTLIAPTTTSETVTAAYGVNVEGYLSVYTLTDRHQTTPVAASGSDGCVCDSSAAARTITLNGTSVTDDVIAGGAHRRVQPGANRITWTGVTRDFEDHATNSGRFASAQGVGTATTTTVQWTGQSASAGQSGVAIAYKESAAPAAAVGRMMRGLIGR